MKQIPVIYISLFLIMLGLVVTTGIISADMTALRAAEFHMDTIAEIGNSNFADSVIDACKSQAAESGYELTVEEFTDEKGVTNMAEVILCYVYKIPFLKIDNRFYKRGYAR